MNKARSRSMVSTRTVPGPRSRLREAFECVLFILAFVGMVLVLSLENVRV